MDQPSSDTVHFTAWFTEGIYRDMQTPAYVEQKTKTKSYVVIKSTLMYRV